MKSAVLVTGATGLLGTEIIKTLITDDECPVYALVRAENEEKALHRLRSFWWEEPVLISALGDRIRAVCGKNINCPKVEEKLKDIPGISEAVLIGENRPYCTALLWTESEIPDLAVQIEKMNLTLSHPEQIKKWKVIDTPLSIKAGELTPNLKVRRAVVEEHYKDEIDEFYK